jgi:RNA polymerase sigma-70 factor (ECF subfamily)
MENKNKLLSKWVDNYADYLFHFAFVRVGDEDVAKDLIQETYYSALKGLDSFEGKSSEKTWLTAILKRKVFDYYKTKNRTIPESKLFFKEDGDKEGTWMEGKAPKDMDFADKDIERTELMEIIMKCISFLPAKTAAVFKLKNLYHYHSENICEELGISKSNYWVLTHRAKLQLRDCLEKKWYN